MHDLTNRFCIQVCTFHSDSGIAQAGIIAPRTVERIKRFCGLSGIFLSRSFRIRLLSAAVFLKGIEISNLRHTVAGAFTVNEVLIAKFDVAGVAHLLRGHFGVDALGGPDDNGAGERFLNGHAIREFTALRSGSHRLPALTRLFEALDQLFGGDFECRLLPGLLDALPLEPRMVRVRFRIEFSLRHPYTGRHEILLFVQAGDDALLLLLGHLTEDDAFVLDLVVVRIAVQVMNSGIHHFFSS